MAVKKVDIEITVVIFYVIKKSSYQFSFQTGRVEKDKRSKNAYE
jgi:hypothetical protein